MNSFRHAEGLFLLWKDDPGPCEHELSGRRWMDPVASIANQEWIANVGLHHLDLVTDGRL